MSRRRDPEQSGVFERAEANRAPLRAKLAAAPSNPWLERDRFRMEANAESAPHMAKPIRRGPGRPAKHAL